MPLVTALRHPPLPPARQRRLGAVLGVAAAVLCLHGWLIGTLAPAWPQRLGEPADAAVGPQPLQVVLSLNFLAEQSLAVGSQLPLKLLPERLRIFA